MATHEAVAHDRQTLTGRLLQARAETDALFQIVRPEALYDRPIAERHRILFYVGHLEAFDWNLLSGPCGLSSTQPSLDRLFAFGIDPVDGQMPADTPDDWPKPPEVRAYRQRVRAMLDPALGRIANPDLLLNVAIEHRLMHAETLAYMFHRMPFEQKTRRSVRRTLDAGPWTPGSIPVPAGSATLGLRRGSGTFGWCNEFEQQTVDVPAFHIDKYKVSNGEFLQFLDAGGYDKESLWTPEDWHWRQTHCIRHPAFWRKRCGQWLYRSMFDELPLPHDWPVYVSHAEAGAYARWRGARLPTEAEWHRAAEGASEDHPDPAPDLWDPEPVQSAGPCPSRCGAIGLIGNGWEWTSTEFAPFPGFQPFPFYPGYSAGFFDGQHYVLKGGSVRTAACMLRRTFRNWFQPRYPYVYAGFRCVGAEE